MATSMERTEMDADDQGSSKNVDHDMIHNKEFKHFFKTLMKEAVKENKEFRERITKLEKQVFDLNEKEKIRGDVHELKCSNAKLEEQNASLQESS